MTTKEIAQDFLQLAGTGKVDLAFDKYAASNFIHHNQYFKGGKNDLKKAMMDAHNDDPNKLVEIKYCYEDKDTVITHSLVEKEDMAIAVVHIFRFEGERIAELWDLGQVIDKNSPNENGLY